MMRNAAFFFFRWFRGRDFDALIDLYRIGVDNFGVAEPERERNADFGFARSRRTDD